MVSLQKHQELDQPSCHMLETSFQWQKRAAEKTDSSSTASMRQSASSILLPHGCANNLVPIGCRSQIVLSKHALQGPFRTLLHAGGRSGPPDEDHSVVLQGWDLLHRTQPVDPFSLVKEEIESVSERLRRSIFTGIPTLRSAAEYFFKVCFSLKAHAAALIPCSNFWSASTVLLYVQILCICILLWHMHYDHHAITKSRFTCIMQAITG